MNWSLLGEDIDGLHPSRLFAEWILCQPSKTTERCLADWQKGQPTREFAKTVTDIRALRMAARNAQSGGHGRGRPRRPGQRALHRQLTQPVSPFSQAQSLTKTC